jgi:hypothetical protein
MAERPDEDVFPVDVLRVRLGKGIREIAIPTIVQTPRWQERLQGVFEDMESMTTDMALYHKCASVLADLDGGITVEELERLATPRQIVAAVKACLQEVVPLGAMIDLVDARAPGIGRRLVERSLSSSAKLDAIMSTSANGGRPSSSVESASG